MLKVTQSELYEYLKRNLAVTFSKEIEEKLKAMEPKGNELHSLSEVTMIA